MKKTLLLLSLAGVLALPAATQASLVLHYTFEEGTGSATEDLAPAAAGDNAGTLLNGAAFDSTGVLGAFCASFDGTDDYVDVAAPGDMLRNVSGYTLAAWVRPGVLPTSGYANVICVSNNNTTTFQSRAVLYVGSNGSVAVGGRRVEGNAFARYESAGGLVQAGAWTHIAATVAFYWSGPVIRLYVNGTDVGIATTTSAFTSGAATANTASAFASVGAQPGGAVGFQGLIDEARIYNHALDAPEIAGIAAPPSDSGTLIQLSGIHPRPSALLAVQTLSLPLFAGEAK